MIFFFFFVKRVIFPPKRLHTLSRVNSKIPEARGKNRLVPRAFEEVLRQRISTSRGDACQNRKSAGSRRDEEKKKKEEDETAAE